MLSKEILALLYWAVEEIGEYAEAYSDPENGHDGHLASSVAAPELHDLLGVVILLVAEADHDDCPTEMGERGDGGDPLARMVSSLRVIISRDDRLCLQLEDILAGKAKRDAAKGRKQGDRAGTTMAKLAALKARVGR